METIAGRIQRLLDYIDQRHIKNGGPCGRYVYRAGDKIPLVYCSVYAALARDLAGGLDQLTSSQRKEWIDYLNRFQGQDGLYRDPAFGLPEDLSKVPLRADAGWAGGIAGWGWWHMTNHIYAALTSLGGVAPKPLALLTPFYREEIGIEEWLDQRNWDLAWSVGNEVLNLGTFLLYARDFHHEPRAGKLITRLLDWLDKRQDTETGYWGTDCISPVGKRQAMCGAYHEYVLYAYEGRPIPNLEKVIDATMSLQNPGGGFGCDGKSGACEDIDAAFIFANAFYMADYRRDDIRRSMALVLPAILDHQNPDGGFVYLRGKPYQYGFGLMSSDADQSCMFPTWFRLLSLAVIGQILTDHEIGKCQWRFNSCPYVQYFNKTKRKK